MAKLTLFPEDESRFHEKIARLDCVQGELTREQKRLQMRAQIIRAGHYDTGAAQIASGRGSIDRYVMLVDRAASPIEWNLKILKKAAGLG